MKKDLGVDTELVTGNAGEFTVWVDGVNVIEKQHGKFPEPGDVVAAVRAQHP